MTTAERLGEILVVFLKFPEPGRVKTRLAGGVGAEKAVEIYCQLVARTLREAGGWMASEVAGKDRSRHVWIYFDPADQREACEEWLAPMVSGWRRQPVWMAQPDGDLGKRLQHIFHQGFKIGIHAMCAIGTDCPGVTAARLDGAFEKVREYGGVIGPTRDGGYYVIGIKSECPALFVNVPWSTSETFSTTMVLAEREGVVLHVAAELEDVDTEEGWRRWQQGEGAEV